jgi:hypothetical protein
MRRAPRRRAPAAERDCDVNLDVAEDPLVDVGKVRKA